MRWELGAIGHGPAAAELTEYLYDEIRAWASERDQPQTAPDKIHTRLATDNAGANRL